MARLRELSFAGLQRVSRPRGAGFALAAVKPRRVSALRLPLSDRRRERDGSAIDGAGVLSDLGVSD
jgi:hypothetical protein